MKKLFFIASSSILLIALTSHAEGLSDFMHQSPGKLGIAPTNPGKPGIAPTNPGKPGIAPTSPGC
jgi:hypothetical protein